MAADLKRLNQEKLEAALQMGHMAHWEFDFATSNFLLNDSFYNLYGTDIQREGSYLIKADDFVRRFVLPGYSHLLPAELAAAYDQPSPDYYREMEFEVRRMDGEIRHFFSFYRMVMGEDGKPQAMVGITQDISERKAVENALRDSEERLRLKLNSILQSDDVVENKDLRNLMDASTLQTLIEDFTRLVRMPIAITDTEGNLIAGNGMQEICFKFHRAHPVSARNCQESDTCLAQSLQPGQFQAYKCKNQMWDVASPIYIGQKHVGNVYTGGFFYDDEDIDFDIFIDQAEWYDFDQAEYLHALRKVPRYSREQVDNLMCLLVKGVTFLSQLGFNNLKLIQGMLNQKRIEQELGEREERFRKLVGSAGYMIYRMSLATGVYEYVSGAAESITGYTAEEIMDYPVIIQRIIHPDWLDYFTIQWNRLIEGFMEPVYEYQIINKAGETRWLHQDNQLISGSDGKPLAIEALVCDITERRKASGQ